MRGLEALLAAARVDYALKEAQHSLQVSLIMCKERKMKGGGRRKGRQRTFTCTGYFSLIITVTRAS